MSAQVLVVNDDRNGVEYVRRLLDELGHTVVAAHSAAQGLATLNASAPDVVLLSLSLRGISGLDPLPVLRHHHPEIPIIAVTDVLDLDTERQARALGAFDVLLTPVEIDRLATALDRRVNTALDLRRAGHCESLQAVRGEPPP